MANGVKRIRVGKKGFVRLGRKRPDFNKPHLRMGRYLAKDLPPAPSNVDYSQAGMTALTNVFLNDQLGCCVISGGWHVLGVETGNAGDLIVATNDQIIADYSAIGGYIPGRPNTDNGCDEQTALAYWTANGFGSLPGTKLLGWASVDATNQQLVSQVCYVFENFYLGLELPDEWVNQGMPMGSGFVWDVAGDPDPGNGHCIMCYGISPQGVLIDTWGMLGTMTWAALAKYCVNSAGGESYVLLSQNIMQAAQATSPSGFNWGQLVADLQAIGGTDVNPPPAPSPLPPAPPSPNPPPPGPTPPAPPVPVNPPVNTAPSYQIQATLTGMSEHAKAETITLEGTLTPIATSAKQ